MTREHGTNSRYTYGCRCADCLHAHNSYNRAWRARQRYLAHLGRELERIVSTTRKSST